MIIDFHTHIFPDKIAEATIKHLAALGDIPPFSDGTVNGLLGKMEEAGVDISVVLPVMTNPKQFDSVNRFAVELNQTFADKQRRLISFAGIHPDCEDIEGKMAFLRRSGFLGVKVHPDYQLTFFDDEKYVRILHAAKENDLILVTHAGVDAGYRNCEVRCTPERVLKLLSKVKYNKLVLAHMGGHLMYDEVMEKLCGEDIYLDTSYVLRDIGEESFNKILSLHSEDKILFGTDTPWSPIKGDVELVKSYVKNPETQEKIFSGNAIKLLGLK